MLARHNILLTGVTGNLGCPLLKEILDNDKKGANVFLLVRANNEAHARKRVNKVFKTFFNRAMEEDPNFKQVKILVGDVSQKHFGLCEDDYRALTKTINTVYHCAALTRFQDDLSLLREANVIGTQRVLDFIEACEHPVDLNYMSTMFIAGNFDGPFRENDFDVGQEFNNPYERSKFEAEQKVRAFAQDHVARVFRISIVVGTYTTGAISSFQMFYKPFYLFSRNVFDEVPVDPDTEINIVPVDVAAEMIVRLARLQPIAPGETFHITGSKSFPIMEVFEYAARYFRFTPPRISTKLKFKSPVIAQMFEESVKPLVSYFSLKPHFDCAQTLARLQKAGYSPPVPDQEFLQRLFAYALQRKYIGRT